MSQPLSQPRCRALTSMTSKGQIAQNGTSTTKSAFRQTMRFPRFKFAAVSLLDGSILVAGGSEETVEVFDLRAGQFMAVANGEQGLRLFPTATLLADGSVLIAGGYSGNGSQATLWRYSR